MVESGGAVYLGRTVANGSLTTKTFRLAGDGGQITAQPDVHALSVTGNRIVGWVPGSGEYGLKLAMAETSA
jgi:hypothetical protein